MAQLVTMVRPSTGSRDALAGLESQISALCAIGGQFYKRGWSLGTSSNYSVVIRPKPLELVITATGRDKGHLTRRDFVRVDDEGHPVTPGQPKASAETLLHVRLAGQDDVGAVLHTHSVWGTVLSDLHFEDGGFEITGYEMLKGLAGVRTHEHKTWMTIFDNEQDMESLGRKISERLPTSDGRVAHGFLIRRHGLYTWGRDLDEAQRQVEILEFLFECEGRRLALTGGFPAATGLVD